MRTSIKRLILSVTATSALMLAPSTHAVPMDAALENDLVNICEALKSDSKLNLHRAIKKSRVSYRQVEEGLVCNGESAREFALTHNATTTAGLLDKHARANNGVLTARRFKE